MPCMAMDTIEVQACMPTYASNQYKLYYKYSELVDVDVRVVAISIDIDFAIDISDKLNRHVYIMKINHACKQSARA